MTIRAIRLAQNLSAFAAFSRVSNLTMLSTAATTSTTPMTSVDITNERRPVELAIGTLTYLVILFMTVFGNSLVVISVFNYRPLKKVQNYFLVSLAASDVAVSVLVMPLHIAKFLMGGKWAFGMILCQVWLTFDILCCTASILNLCAIALDRYWAITKPLEYAQRRTLKLVSLMILGVWSASALISIPPLIGWNDWSTKKLHDHCELTGEKWFVVFSACGSFFVPLVIMATVYLKIFFAARKRLKKNRDRSAVGKYYMNAQERTPLFASPEVRFRLQQMAETAIVAPDSAATTTTNRVDPESPSNEDERDATPKRTQKKFLLDLRRNRRAKQQVDGGVPKGGVGNTVELTSTSQMKRREKISVSKEKRAAKTLAVIMGVFVLCWMPFFLMYLIRPFCDACAVHPKVEQAITWLGYINSAINPVVYTIFNLDFRRAFEKYLCPASFRARRRRLSGVE